MIYQVNLAFPGTASLASLPFYANTQVHQSRLSPGSTNHCQFFYPSELLLLLFWDDSVHMREEAQGGPATHGWDRDDQDSIGCSVTGIKLHPTSELRIPAHPLFGDMSSIKLIKPSSHIWRPRLQAVQLNNLGSSVSPE